MNRKSIEATHRDRIPRKRLNIPLAYTDESHGVKRMRVLNRRLLRTRTVFRKSAK